MVDDFGDLTSVGAAAPQIIPTDLAGMVRTVQFPPAARWFEGLRETIIKPGDTVQTITFRNCETPTKLRIQ